MDIICAIKAQRQSRNGVTFSDTKELHVWLSETRYIKNGNHINTAVGVISNGKHPTDKYL
jgi:hypothetical protein